MNEAQRCEELKERRHTLNERYSKVPTNGEMGKLVASAGAAQIRCHWSVNGQSNESLVSCNDRLESFLNRMERGFKGDFDDPRLDEAAGILRLTKCLVTSAQNEEDEDVAEKQMRAVDNALRIVTDKLEAVRESKATKPA